GMPVVEVKVARPGESPRLAGLHAPQATAVQAGSALFAASSCGPLAYRPDSWRAAARAANESREQVTPHAMDAAARRGRDSGARPVYPPRSAANLRNGLRRALRRNRSADHRTRQTLRLGPVLFVL